VHFAHSVARGVMAITVVMALEIYFR